MAAHRQVLVQVSPLRHIGHGPAGSQQSSESGHVFPAAQLVSPGGTTVQLLAMALLH